MFDKWFEDKYRYKIKFLCDDSSGNFMSHRFICTSIEGKRYNLDICDTKKTSEHIEAIYTEEISEAIYENLTFYYKLEETPDLKVLNLLIDLLIDLNILITEETKNNIIEILNSTCSLNATDEYGKKVLIQISQDNIQNSDMSFKIEDLGVVNIFNEDSYYFIRNNMFRTPHSKSKFDLKVKKYMKNLNLNKNAKINIRERSSLKLEIRNEDINFFA